MKFNSVAARLLCYLIPKENGKNESNFLSHRETREVLDCPAILEKKETR